jgi:Na+(H+)/acetate symporter ActP
VFLRAKAQERTVGDSTGKKTKVFINQVGAMLKVHWRLCIYAILLMAGMLVSSVLISMEMAKLRQRLQFPFAWFPGFVSHLS